MANIIKIKHLEDILFLDKCEGFEYISYIYMLILFLMLFVFPNLEEKVIEMLTKIMSSITIFVTKLFVIYLIIVKLYNLFTNSYDLQIFRIRK